MMWTLTEICAPLPTHLGLCAVACMLAFGAGWALAATRAALVMREESRRMFELASVMTAKKEAGSQ